MVAGISFRVLPKASMFDAVARITATGLLPQQRATIGCHVHDPETGSDFRTEAVYLADSNGAIDCGQTPAVEGAFSGLHPMGLFWSLKQVTGDNLLGGSKFFPSTPNKPVQYNFSLQANNDNIIAQTSCDRFFIHQDVEKRSVRHGRLRGTLFSPKNSVTGGKKLPAIIDLYGTRGGLSEHRAALLASHGFITFALAYFNHDDLPKTFRDLELEYFQEAAQWLLSQEQTYPNGVGVMGTSFGAELSVLMACYLPEVRAVVHINGLHLVDAVGPVKYKGQRLPVGILDNADADEFLIDDKLYYAKYRIKIPSPPHVVFPIEKSRAHFLFIAAEDDQATPSLHSAKILIQRLRENGMSERADLLALPDAGHLLEPPYKPHVNASFHKVLNIPMAFGGEPMAHAYAQVQAWSRLREFFSMHLAPPQQMKPFSLLSSSL